MMPVSRLSKTRRVTSRKPICLICGHPIGSRTCAPDYRFPDKFRVAHADSVEAAKHSVQATLLEERGYVKCTTHAGNMAGEHLEYRVQSVLEKSPIVVSNSASNVQPADAACPQSVANSNVGMRKSETRATLSEEEQLLIRLRDKGWVL